MGVCVTVCQHQFQRPYKQLVIWAVLLNRWVCVLKGVGGEGVVVCVCVVCMFCVWCVGVEGGGETASPRSSDPTSS